MIPFLLITWFLRSLAAQARLTYYWQLKEYRWDRMREFLLRQGGMSVIFDSFHMLLLIVTLTYLFALMLGRDDAITSLFSALIAVVFLADSLRFFHQLVRRKLKRPRLTSKALLILALSTVSVFAFAGALYFTQSLSLNPTMLAFVLALLTLFEADIHVLWVLVFNQITHRVKRRRYQRAAQKRAKHDQLRVVGITGSYGKSSVKEMLSHLLEEDFSVLKTDKNTNTEIGIAHTILHQLRDDHDIFVCEMGAYAPGEIGTCCQMAQPEIGIFTGLNEQHISLFGSLDRTFSAKWELIDSLPADGVGIFNGDALPLMERIKPFRGRAIVCSTDYGDAIAEEITVTQDGVRFRYDGVDFEAPLSGRFQVINLLMALVAAEQLGLSPDRLRDRVRTLRPPEKTMSQRLFSRGTIIDDSYNVNPDGLKAALEHLQLFPDHQRVLFFPGVQELGDQSDRIHRELGAFIAPRVDYAFFHDPNQSSRLSQSAQQAGLTSSRQYLYSDPDEMLQALRQLFQKHEQQPFVILFESRGAEKVLEALK